MDGKLTPGNNTSRLADMRTGLSALAVALLSLVGCASDPKETGSRFKRAPQVAEELGCSSADKEVPDNTKPIENASQTVMCDAGGEIGLVTVNFFVDEGARDQFIELGQSRGFLLCRG